MELLKPTTLQGGKKQSSVHASTVPLVLIVACVTSLYCPIVFFVYLGRERDIVNLPGFGRGMYCIELLIILRASENKMVRVCGSR